MRPEPEDPMARMSRRLDIDLFWRPVVVKIGQVQEWVHIKLCDRSAGPGAAEKPKGLILVVSHKHPVGVEGERGGSVAGTGVPVAAWPAHGRRGVVQHPAACHEPVAYRNDDVR